MGLKKTGTDCANTADCTNKLQWETGDMMMGESFWEADQTSGSTANSDCFRFKYDTHALTDESCGASYPYLCQYICAIYCPDPPFPTSDMTSNWDNTILESGETVM